MQIAKFKVGDRVEKVKGYHYPGVVVAAFETINGPAIRYVVEATGKEYLGMLHIFNEEQLGYSE